MNQIILFENDFTEPGIARLTGRRLDHLNEILGARQGDSLRAGLLNGFQGEAKILSITEDEACLETSLTDEPPPATPLTLICAVQRPKTMKRIFQYAASAGIKKIYCIRTWRVEKSYFDSPVLEEQSINENLILGLEQGRDTILPDVQIRTLFKPFAEDELPSILQGTLPLAAHPGSAQEMPRGLNEPVTLAMGPEGGFIPYEIELLQKKGFIPVHIGQRILRSEYALPSIVGRLF